MSLYRKIGKAWAARNVPDGVQSYKKSIVLFPGSMTSSGWELASPCLMMAEDYIRSPGGFEAHPHRGFVTISILFRGALRHTDFSRAGKGSTAVVSGLDVQVMTTGRGIMHSEMPEGRSDTHMLQLWLNLPSKLKMCNPFHEDVRSASIPIVDFGHGYAVRVLTGNLEGLGTSPANMVHPLLALDITRGGLDGGIPDADGLGEGPGAKWLESLKGTRSSMPDEDREACIDLPIPAGYNGFMYAVQGDWEVWVPHTDIIEGVTATSGEHIGTAKGIPPKAAGAPVASTGSEARESEGAASTTREAPFPPQIDTVAQGTCGSLPPVASLVPAGTSVTASAAGALLESKQSDLRASGSSDGTAVKASPSDPSGRMSTLRVRLCPETGGSYQKGTRGRLLVFLGEPIDEPVVTRGPFVMNTAAEIQQAMRDYQEGKFQEFAMLRLYAAQAFRQWLQCDEYVCLHITAS